MTTVSSRPHQEQLEELYQAIAPQHLRALWTLPEILTAEPTTPVLPHRWSWSDVRPWLIRSGELVGSEEAERRVLLLNNPGLPQRPATTQTLVAGFQVVMPGETQDTHRHTPSALRFIVEGEGGYTVVEGEKTFMRPGDFVTTPNWTWHDHANPTDGPMIWLDGLDVPLIGALNTMFYQQHPGTLQEPSRGLDDSRYRYGAGVRPTYQRFTGRYSPLLNYTYERVREALDRLAEDRETSPHDDVVVEYVNPYTGGYVLPTMAAFAQLLRPGIRTTAHRHTSSAVYLVAEGAGYSIVAGQRIDWTKNDVFVVPTWAWHEHANGSASQPAVLLSFSELPVLRSLDLYREQALETGGGHQQVDRVFGAGA
jgi:gentisate 1,2-dioxygenase